MEKILQLFYNIQLKIQDIKHPYRRGIVRSYVIILLYELEGFMNESQETSNTNLNIGGEEILSKFQVLLKMHFKEERQVGFYAKNLTFPYKTQ